MVEIQEDEKLLIQRAYRTLLQSFNKELNKEDQVNLRAAYELAVEAHSQQRRKSGEPYIMHPIEVSRICIEEIGLGPTAAICALLHDVVEDTDVTLEEIETQFGQRVRMIVDGLTKLDNAYDVESPQAENFRKVLSTLTVDVRVVLIKMADRIHNMRTLGSMPRHKQLKIAAETSFIYAPLAHRLGLYNFKTEFQDLCMKITDRETYSNIAKKLQETKESRTQYIAEFIKPLETHLKEMGIAYRITGRPKSIYSIWNKLKTKKVPFEEIYDLFAVRVIVDVPVKQEKSTCWQVYSIVTDVYQPIVKRLKDWITIPKSNGYESLHTTVVGPDARFVEVQIRSERMDDISERGFAAHWKYKGVSNSPDVYNVWLDNIRAMMDQPDSDAIEFLNDFKSNLFNEEVFVYTPKGDMKILPKGATALDFAFAIHTDVGSKSTAIKINNKLVPMGYKLQNGDKIHVTTSPKQKPKDSWLKMVVTSRARTKIRSALKEDRRQEGQLAREALDRKFKNLKIDNSEANIDTIIRHLKIKSHIDFFFAVAKEELDINDVLKKFEVEHGKLIPITAPPVVSNKTDLEEIRIDTPSSISKTGLYINGEPAENYKFELATCCNPVNGDDIFGYVSNYGLKIHRSNCPNSTNLMARFGYRILKAEWNAVTNTNFSVNLLIIGVDDGPGVIQNITAKISSQLGLNIRSFHIDGNEGYFEGKVKLQVKDKNQLYLLMKALKDMEGISSVTRVD